MQSIIQYQQATGDCNFQNLKLGLEVFLNFFPCVYISQGLSETKFYGDFVYKFKKIMGRTDFSVQVVSKK